MLWIPYWQQTQVWYLKLSSKSKLGVFYNEKDVDIIKQLTKKLNVRAVVTTRKDFVKIQSSFLDYKIYLIEVEHQVNGEKALTNYIKDYIK